MNFDPNTYQPTVEYPDRAKTKQAIKQRITAGELTVPPDQILSVEDFIEQEMCKELAPVKKAWKEAVLAAAYQFKADMEQEHGFGAFPEKVRNKIHALAWSEGHASGYAEVRNCYYEYVELALLCLQPVPANQL